MYKIFYANLEEVELCTGITWIGSVWFILKSKLNSKLNYSQFLKLNRNKIDGSEPVWKILVTPHNKYSCGYESASHKIDILNYLKKYVEFRII